MSAMVPASVLLDQDRTLRALERALDETEEILTQVTLCLDLLWREMPAIADQIGEDQARTIERAIAAAQTCLSRRG